MLDTLQCKRSAAAEKHSWQENQQQQQQQQCCKFKHIHLLVTTLTRALFLVLLLLVFTSPLSPRRPTHNSCSYRRLLFTSTQAPTPFASPPPPPRHIAITLIFAFLMVFTECICPRVCLTNFSPTPSTPRVFSHTTYKGADTFVTS